MVFKNPHDQEKIDNNRDEASNTKSMETEINNFSLWFEEEI